MVGRNKGEVRSICLVASFVITNLVLGTLSIYAGPRSPWHGHALFREKGCIHCHSIYGEGGKDGPDLGKHKFFGSYLDLAAEMWNHLPGMLKRMQATKDQFPEFDREEMEHLVTYLSYMRYIGEPGNERTGRKLLKSKGCISCHKFGGTGGDIGPDITARDEYLSPLVLVESMWNHGPNMMELFEQQKIKRPMFKGSDIVNLIAGIQSYMRPARIPAKSHYLGNPVRGKELSVEKGCMYCHSVRGVGGRPGPDFADLDFDYSATQIAGRMWNHGPKMWDIMKREGVTFPVFNEGEMADIIAYLYGLRLDDEPGDAQKGRRLVAQKCIACHTLQGEGAGVSPELSGIRGMDSPLDMIAIMWNHAPGMREKQVVKHLKWMRLSGRDLADLYAFLQSLPQSTGG